MLRAIDGLSLAINGFPVFKTAILTPWYLSRRKSEPVNWTVMWQRKRSCLPKIHSAKLSPSAALGSSLSAASMLRL